MKRLTLIPLCAALAIVACDSPSPTGVPGISRGLKGGSAFAITGFSAIDPGAGPGDERPNADAAAASFDAAAGSLRTLKFENFEGAPLGNFTSLTLAEMTVTLSGAGSDVDAGITNVTGDAILGYNTTGDGSRHLRFVPPFGEGTVSATFTPNVPLQSWGAYLTGVGTVPNTSVEIVFDDGTAQTFAVPGNAAGGATFFGFTDPGKIIKSVTVRETLTSGSTRDILGIDDVRYAPANGNQEVVPAGEAATVTVTENGKAVAGIVIPAGTFAEEVLVTVQFVDVPPGAQCHDFLLGQIGRCLEVTAKDAAGQKAALLQDVTVGLCLPSNLSLEIFKFETPQGRAIPLQQAATPFLDCTGFTFSSVAPRNWLEGLAMGLSERVGRFLTPKLLYAADRGFGGIVPKDDGLSSFTWASPIQVSHAGLTINLFNSGKDVFAVAGVFSIAPKGFEPFALEAGFSPATEAVTVAFGKHVHTIPAGSFRYSLLLKRWVYAAKVSTGITAMAINQLDGTFTVAGAVPTGGDVLPVYRPFTVQIGNRVQGAGLLCGADRKCSTPELLP